MRVEAFGSKNEVKAKNNAASPPNHCAILDYDRHHWHGLLHLNTADFGKFVRDFMLENAVGQPTLKASHRANDERLLEETGAKLRGMMPWISAGKMVDKERN
jgi:ketol-acid reductoisomerase